jgi:hypothetical protein
MPESLSISFSTPSTVSTSSGSGRGDIWLELEQEYTAKASKEATIYDLNQMLNLVKMGNPAYEYIADSCPYVTVIGTKIYVYLDFFVWPSALDLEYNLTSGMGVITGGVITKKPVEFNIIFNGSSYEELPYMFEGTLTPQMPLIKPDGSKFPFHMQVSDLSIVPDSILGVVVGDSSVSLSEKV